MADSDTTQQVDVKKLIAKAIQAEREARWAKREALVEAIQAKLEARRAKREALAEAIQAKREAEPVFTTAQWVGAIGIIASLVGF